MKKFGLFLMVLAVVALTAATSQAAVQLLSDYTFDNAAGGQVVSGASGGSLLGGATIGTGGIGAGVLSSTVNADTFRLDAPFAAPGAAAAVGTESIWFKLAQSGTTSVVMVYCESNNSDNVNHGVYGLWGTGKLAWYNKAKNGTDATQKIEIALTGTSWIDGGAAWHNLTATYNLNGTTGSTAALYLDGALATTTLTTGQTGIDATNAGLGAYTQGGMGWGSSGTATYANTGSRDDFATWGTQLDGTQVAALWNLGLTGVLGTKYNAKDASALFDAFSTASNTVTNDGRAWTYVASGLAGTAGAVGSNYVVLDGNGGGMSTIPEPGTLALLATGAIGLLVFAWRRRK